MPYNTAATCLHIDAQSGQLQVKMMSFGDGNSPVFCSQRRAITPLEKRPCRSSTSESMAPVQSVQMARQSDRGTGPTVTFTSSLAAGHRRRSRSERFEFGERGRLYWL